MADGYGQIQGCKDISQTENLLNLLFGDTHVQ